MEACGVDADAILFSGGYVSMVGNVLEIMTQLYLSWTTILYC
jgi:hypothetical protein